LSKFLNYRLENQLKKLIIWHGKNIERISKNKIFFEDKIETANFFFNRVLTRIDSHYKSATSGSKYIMNFKFN